VPGTHRRVLLHGNLLVAQALKCAYGATQVLGRVMIRGAGQGYVLIGSKESRKKPTSLNTVAGVTATQNAAPTVVNGEEIAPLPPRTRQNNIRLVPEGRQLGQA